MVAKLKISMESLKEKVEEIFQNTVQKHKEIKLGEKRLGNVRFLRSSI